MGLSISTCRMGMQVPTATWQGIPSQAQLPAAPQQMAAPAAALQQPGLVFPIQQYQVCTDELLWR